MSSFPEIWIYDVWIFALIHRVHYYSGKVFMILYQSVYWNDWLSIINFENREFFWFFYINLKNRKYLIFWLLCNFFKLQKLPKMHFICSPSTISTDPLAIKCNPVKISPLCTKVSPGGACVVRNLKFLIFEKIKKSIFYLPHTQRSQTTRWRASERRTTIEQISIQM